MRIFLISILALSFYGFTNCDLAENSDKVVIAGGSLTEIVYDLKEEEKLIAVDIRRIFPLKQKNYHP